MTDAQTEARAIARLEYVHGSEGYALRPDAGGRYVLYTDHATALAAKEAELDDAVFLKDAAEAALRKREVEINKLRTQLAEERKALAALANFAFWFRSYPEFKPNPDFLDEVVADREAALPFIPPARRAREAQGGENNGE